MPLNLGCGDLMPALAQLHVDFAFHHVHCAVPCRCELLTLHGGALHVPLGKHHTAFSELLKRLYEWSGKQRLTG
jgi:hypothetical protein